MPTIFEKAAGVFDGWTDPDTGLRVLKIAVRGQDVSPRVEVDGCWRTWDHQFTPFLEGGRKLLARGFPLRPGIDGHEHRVIKPIHVIDLTTGYPGPQEGIYAVEWPSDLPLIT